MQFLPTVSNTMTLFDWIHSFSGPGSSSQQGRLSLQERSGDQKHALPIVKRGKTLAADFSHRQETVHTMCRVEKQNERVLRLCVVSEIGKVPLLGLKEGSHGHFETQNSIFPFQVVRVALPVVEVEIFSHQAHRVHRQLLRIPASFTVRFRPLGASDVWTSGKGIDISAGGCCFAFSSSHLPTIRTRYNLEMTFMLPHSDQEQLIVVVEVRWSKRANGEVQVGVEVQDPAQRRGLAVLVTKLQQLMSRHPKDYLLS